MKPSIIITEGRPIDVLDALDEARDRALRAVLWTLAEIVDARGISVYIEPVSIRRDAVLIWNRRRGARPSPAAALYLDDNQTPECADTLRALWRKYNGRRKKT